MSSIKVRFALARGDFRLDAEFEAPGKGVTALFGQSGSGKTTLLRCIAGLERAPGGFLAINGEVWQDETRGHFLPTHKRPLGYVFQDARLFPHLNVRRNLEFGWKRTPVAQRQVAFEQAVGWMGLDKLLTRSPQHLSGGEKQRVAIARALLTGPKLLIMDEPLAALDAAAKAEILPYFDRLHEELAIPLIYVSHALEEVTRLADHLLPMAAGRITAAGSPSQVLTRLDLPLSHLDDAAAAVDAVVAGHDEEFGLSYLDFPGGRITTPRQPFASGHAVRVRILAKDVSLALDLPKRTSILNIFPARVAEIVEHNPAQLLVSLTVGEARLLARITRKSAALLDLQPGMEVYAQVKGVALMP
jgi:molybdate transport system ATP-binding protein